MVKKTKIELDNELVLIQIHCIQLLYNYGSDIIDDDGHGNINSLVELVKGDDDILYERMPDKAIKQKLLKVLRHHGQEYKLIRRKSGKRERVLVNLEDFLDELSSLCHTNRTENSHSQQPVECAAHHKSTLRSTKLDLTNFERLKKDRPFLQRANAFVVRYIESYPPIERVTKPIKMPRDPVSQDRKFLLL